MDIKWIRTIAAEGEPTPDENPSKLIIQVAGAVEITVFGDGCGDAVLRVRGMDQEGHEAVSRVSPGVWATIARAIVWASPTTVAHLVMDTIEHQ